MEAAQLVAGPSVQADPKKMKAAQPVVCDPPAAQGADQEVAPPNRAAPAMWKAQFLQSARQTNGQESICARNFIAKVETS